MFTGEGQEFKINLEKSLDGSVQVSGLTEAEESERTDEGHVESSDEQDVSIDVELSSSATDKDGTRSMMKECVDANTSVEVVELPEIEEHHSTLDIDGVFVRLPS